MIWNYIQFNNILWEVTGSRDIFMKMFLFIDLLFLQLYVSLKVAFIMSHYVLQSTLSHFLFAIQNLVL